MGKGVIKTENCLHATTIIEHKVIKLVDEDMDIEFRLEIKLTCKDCLRPFEFMAKGGFSSNYPTRDLYGMELRIPIKPI